MKAINSRTPLLHREKVDEEESVKPTFLFHSLARRFPGVVKASTAAFAFVVVAGITVGWLGTASSKMTRSLPLLFGDDNLDNLGVQGLQARIYVYEDVAQVFKESVDCVGKGNVENNVDFQHLSDFEFYKAMLTHPTRVLDPANANMFYMPMFIAHSAMSEHLTDRCPAMGSHADRVARVTSLLQSSQWYQRSKGLDHFTVFTYWDGGRLNIGNDIASEFRNIVIGWMEVSDDQHLVIPLARHIFEVPYFVKQYGFVSSLTKVYNFEYLGTTGESSTPLACSAGSIAIRTCLCEIRPAELEQLSVRVECLIREGHSQFVADHNKQARYMQLSHYCVVMRGDTLSSARLYAAIANDCVPVIISDGSKGAFVEAGLDWSKFSVRIPETNFARDPVGSLKQVLATYEVPAVAGTKGAELLRQLRLAKQDLLWDIPGSRVVTHIISEVKFAILKKPHAYSKTVCVEGPGVHLGGKDCRREWSDEVSRITPGAAETERK